MRVSGLFPACGPLIVIFPSILGLGFSRAILGWGAESAQDFNFAPKFGVKNLGPSRAGTRTA